MTTSMEIDLELDVVESSSFAAIARIHLGSNNSQKSFTFLLNNDLVISEVLCNGKIASFEKCGEETLTFLPLSQKIAIHSDEAISEIILKYSGNTPSGWNNTITKDIVSLSWYSVWYPQKTSIEIERDKVNVLQGGEYFLVKGIFHEQQNTWEYGGKGFDPYNIMLFRKEKLKVVSNQYMNIYFVDETIRKQAENSQQIYRDFIAFYNDNLFSKREIPVMDIACTSPAFEHEGGYLRKDLIWCTFLDDSEIGASWFLGHEIAHIWCAGANTNSWEDWLNETTAEWSVLLFALHQGNKELFDYSMNQKLERVHELPCIKTDDGSRPDGVHDKGTVLFYEMYKIYGLEAVQNVVRTFTDLENKTTASLLSKLRDDNHKEIADFIDEGISK